MADYKVTDARGRSQTYKEGGAVKDTTKYIKKVDVLKYGKLRSKSPIKAGTAEEKIAARKAKRAKADSTKGKSRLELMRERVKADKAKGKK